MAKQQKRQELPRKFKALIIPREIWLDESTGIYDKVFLAEIDSLDHDGNGCYASNSYFARFFHLSSRSVQRVISRLCQKGLLKIEVRANRGNQRILTLTDEYLALLGLSKEAPTNDRNDVRGHDRSDVTPSRQKCHNPLTSETSLPHDRSDVTPHDRSVIQRIIPIPKVLERGKSREDLGFENSSNTALGLDVEKERNEFCNELQKIFVLNKTELTTYGRIAIHMAEGVKAGKFDIGIFCRAIGWAQTAKANGKVNPKKLLTATLVQETGYKKQELLLGRSHHQRKAAERIEFEDKKRKVLADLRKFGS